MWDEEEAPGEFGTTVPVLAEDATEPGRERGRKGGRGVEAHEVALVVGNSEAAGAAELGSKAASTMLALAANKASNLSESLRISLVNKKM